MLPLRVLQRTLLNAALKNLHVHKHFKKLRPSTFVLQKYYSTQELYVNSPFSSVEIPNVTIPEYVFENYEKWPEKIAVECGVSGRKCTYSELKTMSRRVALALLNSGLKPGQIVTLVLPNIPEFLFALFGSLEAGLIVSTINPLYSADEIRHQITNSGSVCVITYQQKLNDVNQAIAGIKNSKLFPTIVLNNPSESLPDGTRSFRELLEMKNLDESVLKMIKRNPDDTALLLYSSGTTGLPKGVILTHRQIVSNCVQITHPNVRFAYETTSSHQDVVNGILPFFHCYGLTVVAFLHLRIGCKVLTLPNFEPESFLKVLKQSTIAFLVPPLIQFLANQPSVTSKHMEKLRCILNGAAGISLTDAYRLLSKKHLIITSGYGMTEAGPVITTSRNTCVDLATVGHALSNSQMKIVHTESGEIINPKEPGEICVKGPQVMSGYFKNKQATDETLKDGWLHTGDVGYFNDEGNLYIVDRLKELIKVKGFQVAPLELEELLKQYPGVTDVAVVGKPDSRFGEIPVAFIVPSADKKPTEKELQNFVNSKVAEYKRINSFIFTSSIPKNTTGKILRKKLKEIVTKEIK